MLSFSQTVVVAAKTSVSKRSAERAVLVNHLQIQVPTFLALFFQCAFVFNFVVANTKCVMPNLFACVR